MAWMSWRSLSLLALSFSFTAQAGQQIHFLRGTLDANQFSSFAVSPQNSDWIVQFKKPVTNPEQNLLKTRSIKVMGYLPDDALVVRATKSDLDLAQAENKNIRAIMAYPAEMKLAAELPAMSIFNQNESKIYLVKTFLNADTQNVEREIEKQNLGNILESSGTTILVQTANNHLILIARLNGVEHIQEPAVMKTMNMDLEASDAAPANGDYTDLTGYESGTKIMNFESAWSQGYKGQGQMASMADTGLDSGDLSTIHPDFKGAVTEGQIFGLYSKTWGDPMGHGTHVAGSIVGRGTASSGKLLGGAHEAQFVGQSMWSPMMSNLMVPSKLSDLFTRAYRSGARVHSNSWGAANNFGAYDDYASQVDAYSFQNQDMLIVFAAGNSGVDKDKDGRIDPGSMSSPGTAKNALTVGASENLVSNGGLQKTVSQFRQAKEAWPAEPIWSSKISDNPQGLAMFSSRGPTNDNRTKPEVVAPGTNILSVRSQNPKAEVLWGAYNKDYVWSGGTSMATPLVAGAATVTRQILQEKYKIQNPSAALVKAVLMNTATDLFPGQYGAIGANHGQEIITTRPNSDEGFGRVDMNQVVSRGLQVWDEVQGLAQGQSKTYEFEVTQAQKVVINMVYMDAPGSVNAATALVNDLDMSLASLDGVVNIGSNDHINNFEVIESTLKPGKYKITVSGVKIPQGLQGAQPFALVMSSY